MTDLATRTTAIQQRFLVEQKKSRFSRTKKSRFFCSAGIFESGSA